MRAISINDEMPIDIVTVNGKPYMFTCMRLLRDEIPNDLFCYGVRGDDETTGGFAQIKQHVLVNHWGDLVGKDPLPLDSMDAYWCEDEDGQYIGEQVASIKEYKDRYKDLTVLCK